MIRSPEGPPVGVLGDIGFWIGRDYLSAEECETVEREIEAYWTGDRLPKIEREPVDGVALKYRVIGGRDVRRSLPRIWDYQFRLLPLVETLFGGALEPWREEQIVVNVNLFSSGDSYKPHRDRCPVTALLYPVVACRGGELELTTSSGREVVTVRQGDLVVLSSQVVHAVYPILGGQRVSIPVAFGSKNQEYGSDEQLDDYLYSA